jgi:lincosamide nucleotidyltransferase
MVRLAGDSTQHWLTPSRKAEDDLPAEVVRALHGTTATADGPSLERALTTAWGVGRDAWQQLAGRHGFALPEALFEELDQRLSGPASQS